MNIEFTRLAEEDLVNIKSYLQKARNEDFASQVLDGIFAAISTLAEQPAAKGCTTQDAAAPRSPIPH